MFNRKLSTLAAVAFLSILPVIASASTGRLAGMALPGDYTADYTSIYAWPSSITGLGNLVYGEFGSVDNYSWGDTPSDMSMGAVLPNLWEGRFGVWALHLRQTTNGLASGTAASTSNGDPNTNGNQSFDLGWGIKMGKHAFGLQLNRSYNSLEDELPGTTWTFKQNNAQNENTGTGAGNLSRNIMGVGAGFGAEMSEKMTVEGALMWQTRSFENGHNGAASFKNSDDGGSNYLLALRAMHKCTPNLTMVPVAKYYSFDLSNKQESAGNPTVTRQNTVKGWQVGAAGNWTIGSNDLFVLGATVSQNKLDQQENLFGVTNQANGYSNGAGAFSDTLTATESGFPTVFMALETQVNGWLTLRFGANKGVMHTLKIEGHNGAGGTAQSETITIHDSPFSMATGAGVKLGSLKFDAVLTTGFYNDPFSTLTTGDNSNYGSPFTKVSATYNW